MNVKQLLVGIVIFTSVSLIGFAAQQGSAPAPAKQKTLRQSTTQPQNEGQQVFQQNCSRCHAAPEGFSQRISGTIVRHMRVRASLSQYDERVLLRFLNP